jgi:succinyl-diaminopimelate desuccinylase
MIRLQKKNKIKTGTLKLLATVGEEKSGLGATQLASLGYTNDIDAMIIGEPTNLNVASTHKGLIWMRIHVEGQSAHGSSPEKGKNAIKHLVDALHKIRQYADEEFQKHYDELVGSPTMSVNRIEGGNTINQVADQAHADIDIRLIARFICNIRTFLFSRPEVCS